MPTHLPMTWAQLAANIAAMDPDAQNTPVTMNVSAGNIHFRTGEGDNSYTGVTFDGSVPQLAIAKNT